MRVWMMPLVLLCLVNSGCPEETENPLPDATADVTADVTTDTLPDQGPDTLADATAETLEDTDVESPETTSETGSETSADGDASMLDGSAEVASEVDTQPDAEPEIAPEVDIVQPPDVTVSTLPLTEFCAGSELSIEVSVEGPLGAYDVDIELSDSDGDFGDPTVIGSATVEGTDTIACTWPSDAVGTGYRVRAVTGPTSSADNGTDLTLLGSPALGGVSLQHRHAILGGKPFGINNGADADTWTWDFGPGATPATSDLKSPQWSYDQTGLHTVTLTASSAAGCIATKTFEPRTLDCDTAVIGADTDVLKATNTLTGNSNKDLWVCYGASITKINDAGIAFLEPGAALDPISSSMAIYAPAGSSASISGSISEVVVLYEEGANVSPSGAYDAKLCPSITYDLTDAPATGCTTAGVAPFSATVGALPAGDSCPQSTISVPYTTDSAPGANNIFIVQMSDATGDFASPTNLESITSSAPSGTLDVTLPAGLQASEDYKLRIVTTDPPGIGPESADSIRIAAPLSSSFSLSTNHALLNEEVTFTLTSVDPYESLMWDFGPNATPSTSTEPNPTVTFGATGQQSITLTMTSASGCSTSLTKSNLRIFSCNPAAPANANRYSVDEDVTASAPVVACGGAALTVYSANRIYLLSGGGAEVYSDDDTVVFAEEGAGVTADGFPEGVLVADADANLGDVSGFAAVLTCPELIIDDSAVAGTCPPFTPEPDSLSFDAGSDVDWCPGEQVVLPYTLTGSFPPGSDVRIRISNAAGEFGSGNAGILDTDYGAYSGAFEFSAPGSAPGTYQLRAEVVSPQFIGETLSATIYAGPTAAFEPSTQFIMAGDSVTFSDESSGEGLTYEWTFPGGDPATATGPDPGSVIFSGVGQFEPSLTVTNAGGCSNTIAGDYYDTVETFTCDPVMPANTKQVGSAGFGHPVLVCDGQSGADGGGKKYIFVESGASYTHQGGGLYIGYVRAGGTFNAANSGSIVIYEEGATVTGLNQTWFSFMCPALSFDDSQVSGPVCQ